MRIALQTIVIAAVIVTLSATPADAVTSPSHIGVDVDPSQRGQARVDAIGQDDTPGVGAKPAGKPHVKHGIGRALGPNDVPPVCIDYVTPEQQFFPVDDCWVITLAPGQAPPPAGAGAQATAATLAQQYVAEYIRTIDLPSPAPEISAHSGGIAGALHSLDLHIDDSNPAWTDPDTPFGPLLVRFHGTFTVNWGDGSIDTYSSTGAPFPYSDITHSWSISRHYNIAVTAHWTAEWTFGQYSGTTPGLATAGLIANWPVLEAQAVLVG